MALGFLSRAAAFLCLVWAPSAAAEGMLRASSREVVEVERRDEQRPYMKDCTALVAFGVDSKDSTDVNQTWLSCMTADDMIHDVEGACKEWVEEKIMKGLIKSNHTTMSVNDATFDTITDRVTLAEFPPTLFPGLFTPPYLQNRQKGNRTILAVRIVTLDAAPLITEKQVRSSLFSATDGSLRNHMAACSQDNLLFQPKKIPALLGGPITVEAPVTRMTVEACLAEGEGKETAEISKSGVVNCPEGSFFCYGGVGGRYITEFAKSADLSQTANTSKMLTCYTKDDSNKVVDTVTVNVTTHRRRTGFQFEILGNKYFIAMTQLKPSGVGESIFHYPYIQENAVYVGAVPKTGVQYTPFLPSGTYRDINNVKMCVMPRTTTCKRLADEAERTMNEFDEFGFNNGVVTVMVPHYISEGDSVIRNAVTTTLITHFGIKKPEEIADFVMYCLPDGVMSRFAYAYVYSWLSVYSDGYCANLAAQMRQLGHNFGFGPSRSWLHDYGDWTGMMGDNNFKYGRRCFNGPKLYQSGWYADNTVVITRKTPKMDIDLHGYIKSIEPGMDKNMPKLIKLDRKSKTDIYIMFNWGTDRNAHTKGIYRNKVMIAETGFDGKMFDFSFTLAHLAAGETYFAPLYYDGLCDLNVTVGDIDIVAGISEVTVTGCIAGAPTESPTGAPTAPTEAPTPAPTHLPPPECYAVAELCAAEGDCCDGGGGTCVKLATKDNLNVMVVCTAAGVDPEDAVVPPGPDGGTCNDNAECEPGESCISCPNDCNGQLSGEPESRYCCENNRKPRAPFSVKITDSRCSC